MTTPDDSGSGNDGVLGVPMSPLAHYRFPKVGVVGGRVGNAFTFRRRQWVLGENSECFASDHLSVMAWVWMESPEGVPTIVAKSAWPIDGWWLLTTSGPPFNSERQLELGLAWGSGMTHVQSGYQWPLHEWHHLAVTMDNELHEVQFFIDGRLFGKKHTGVRKWQVNHTASFAVADFDGTGRWPWNGKIDDVRVYNRTVSEDEVLAAYAQAGN